MCSAYGFSLPKARAWSSDTVMSDETAILSAGRDFKRECSKARPVVIHRMYTLEDCDRPSESMIDDTADG